MSYMSVDRQLCTLCGNCVEACPFGAIVIEDEKVNFTDDCRLCGACVDACPEGAISLVEEILAPAPATAEQNGQKAPGDASGSSTFPSSSPSLSLPPFVIDKESARGVLVFIEQREGRMHPVSLEMIGKGLELAGALHQPLWCVVVGSGIEDLAGELLYYGVEGVYLFDQPELRHYKAEPYTTALCKATAACRPAIMLIGATHIGRSLAPRVATRLRTGLTADCTSLDVRPNGELVQTRPAFGGNVMARIITPHHRPQMATVRYKVMEAAKRQAERRGEVYRLELSPAELTSGITVLEVMQGAKKAAITEADVIVAAGRGAGNARGLALLSELAQRLGGMLGSSRPLVEQGLMPQSQQVGLSGRTVRPKLYMACGISGAVQHLAGMRGAETIIAINKDPNAPIFDVAHVAIVGDLYEIVPGLIKMLGGEGSDAKDAADAAS
ncbi:MAG TPA: electron transfer flavoprotein subunit alpha [Firmicutes bacterium]|nr:electron transfer flavoprotein subunit alpha [Bacillota bacterium]